LKLKREKLVKGQKQLAPLRSGDVTSFTVNGCVLRDVAPCCTGPATVCLPHDDGTFLVGGGDGTITVFDPTQPPTVLDALKPLCRVAGSVTSVSRVRGYDQVVVGTSEGLKYVVPLKGRSGEAELLEESHCAAVSEVSFAPPGCFGVNGDGGPKVVVSASADGSLRAWALEPRLRGVMKAACKNVGGATCVAFTPDALLTGWGDGNVRCHDAASGELLWTLPNANQGGVTRIATAHGLHFFVTGGVNGEVRVWDMRTRSMISNLKEHSSRVVGLAVLDDDQHVVGLCTSNQVDP
jgi:WD40 repeat protein